MRASPFHLPPFTFHLSAALLFLCASATPGQCPAGAWTPLAPMNEPRQELAAAALDGRIYTVGGLAGRANALEIYATATNTWTTGPDFPVETDHAWAVALNGRVYAGGGRVNRVFFYDPATNAWTEIAPSAYVHGGTPAAGVIGGRIYLAGGTGGGMSGNEAEVYDPATNGWAILPPMACARNHTAGGVFEGKLYVAGGRPGNQNCLEVYDPATNGWTRKANMPTGRSGVAGAFVGRCFYVFGGEGNGADPLGIFHQVEAYDAATDTWTALPPMQTGRHGIYAAGIGGTIYLPGGATAAGFGVTGIHESYVVPTVVPELIPRQEVILAPRRRRG